MADLSHAKQGLYDQQSQARQLTAQLAVAHEHAQQAGVLASPVASKDEYLAALQEQVIAVTGNAGTLSARVRELELALATSQATLASQQEIFAELQPALNLEPTANPAITKLLVNNQLNPCVAA